MNDQSIHVVSKNEKVNDFLHALSLLEDPNVQFKNFSESLRNNDFFIFQYFSTVKAKTKELQKIPSHLLENPAFIFNCLKVNPDIYLILEPEFQTKSFYKEIEKYHPSKILKYATIEEQNSYEFCKKHLNKHQNNYKYISDELKSNFNICKSVFFYMPQLVKFLPSKIIKDKDFVTKLLLDNLNIFQYLPKEYLNDKDICNIAVIKSPIMFSNVSKELKEDIQWVESILNLLNSFRKKEIQFILPYLPDIYFTDEFCNKYQEPLSHIFEKIPKSLRSSQTVLVAIFKDSSLNNSYPYNVNYISDSILKKELKEILKTKQSSPDLVGFINSYFLHNQLEQDLINSQNNTKKMKI